MKLELQLLSVFLGALTLAFVIYQAYRNFLVGPDIKVVGLRCLKQGQTHVFTSWTWRLKVRNDGSRGGEIRNTRIDVFEVRPETMSPRLEIRYSIPRGMDGLYQKGETQEITLSIQYKDRPPDSHLDYGKVQKLVAVLKWSKETRKGFSQDSARLALVPEPEL